jgi:hypothetical protein
MHEFHIATARSNLMDRTYKAMDLSMDISQIGRYRSRDKTVMAKGFEFRYPRSMVLRVSCLKSQ